MVLIDEYDKPLLDVTGPGRKVKDNDGYGMTIEEYNRNILNAPKKEELDSADNWWAMNSTNAG